MQVQRASDTVETKFWNNQESTSINKTNPDPLIIKYDKMFEKEKPFMEM